MAAQVVPKGQSLSVNILTSLNINKAKPAYATEIKA